MAKKNNITPRPPLTAKPRIDENLRGGGPQAEGDMIKTLEDNWKRALADYQNLMKRVETDKKEFVKFQTANMLSKLLPTLDILELAATHSQDQGVKMAVKQFQDVLASEGLQEIIPQNGEVYDHQIHECIETVPGDADDVIAEMVQKGYKIGDFVIRPAKVKVSKLN